MVISIIAFIVAFGLLVLVHEFGHFWVARRSGVFVERFSIGFGPKLFGFKWKETDFCVSLFPLGGYVKMRGESDEEAIDPADTRAFSNKPVAKRSAIVLAGPLMNLVLSFVLMPLVFWIGHPEPVFLDDPCVIERILPSSPAEQAGLKIGDQILTLNGKTMPHWRELLQNIALTPVGAKLVLTAQQGDVAKTFWLQTEKMPGGEESYLGLEKFFGEPSSAVVKEVLPKGPADRAGLKPGDQIAKVQGQAVQNWDDLVRLIQRLRDQPATLEVKRETQTLTLTVQSEWDPQTQRYLIGIQGAENQTPLSFSIKRYSFLEAIPMGFKANWENFLLTLTVLKKLVTFQLSYKTLGGPVRIAYTLAKASASGLADFLYFTAFLSLQLGILNLLPIPVLDGGHIVFFLVEAIRRKPLSIKARLIAQQIGLALLITLIVLVTWNDLEKLFF